MRAFATLIWEQWRQTWRGLALISAALAVYWLLLELVEPLVFFIFSNNARIALSAAYVPVVGAMGLLFMQESRSQIGFAYPRRMFWLPVHTYALVGAQFLYKLTVIMLLSLAAGYVCANTIKPTFIIVPQVVFFMTATAALLGLVFLACGYGGGTGFALFLAAGLVSLIGFQPVYADMARNFLVAMPVEPNSLAGMALTLEEREALYVYTDFSPWAWAGGVGTIGWFAIVSYIAARHARSEVPADRVGRWIRTASNFVYLDRDLESFRSPEAAQRWFEWRRVVYLYPWLAVTLGLLMVATLRASPEDEENKFIVGFSLLAVAPAIVAVLIGYAMTRPDPRYMWFVGGRPLTSISVTRSRLWVAAKAIGSAYGLALIAYTCASFVLYGNANPINALIVDLRLITSTYGNEEGGAAMLAGAAWLSLIVTWSLFWLGRSAGMAAWIAGVIAGAYFYFSGSPLYAHVDDNVISPMWLVFGSTLTIIVLCAIVGVYAWAIRAKLLTLSVLPLIVGMVALTGAAIFQFREVIGQDPPVVALAVWSLLPTLPFASVPLTFAWQRHR